MRTQRTTAIGAVLLLAGVLLWLAQASRRPRLDAAQIVTQIQPLNQLATVRYTLQKVVGLKTEKVPVGSESILLIMQATVVAGIDLAALQAKDVTIRPDGAVLLRLPPAQVLNLSVDEKETRVWDRQKTWWTPWIPYDKDLEKHARESGLASIRAAALEMGILKQAERNAASAIKSLLQLAGVKEVVILPASVS